MVNGVKYAIKTKGFYTQHTHALVHVLDCVPSHSQLYNFTDFNSTLTSDNQQTLGIVTSKPQEKSKKLQILHFRSKWR